MTEVIPIAFSARWGVPVCLVQQNKMKWVRGPAEAISCMRNDFVVQSGQLTTALCTSVLQLSALNRSWMSLSYFS
jgi:hypothetical protein